MPIKKIARANKHSRKLVRDVLRGLTGDVFRARQSSLDAYLPRLDAEWTACCRNRAELWPRLSASGFTGSLRAVGEWATRRRRSERVLQKSPGKVPSARVLSPLMTTGRDNLTKAEAVHVPTIEAEVPTLDEAKSLLSLSSDEPRTKASRSRHLDRGCGPQPSIVVRAWLAEGQVERRCSSHATVVERPDRRADYPPEDCAALDVRSDRARPTQSSADRRVISRSAWNCARPKVRRRSRVDAQRCLTAIHAYIDQNNAEFKPFVKPKSADAIYASIKPLSRQTSNPDDYEIY